MKSNGKLCPLGKLVVKALTDQDKTKTQLAAEIGTSPQYLSYILYGVRSGEKYLPAIIAALNLDPRKVEKVTAAYVTVAFVWSKKTVNGKTVSNLAPWTLKNCELCLMGTRGRMVQYKQKNNIPQLVEAVRTRHSEKPEEVRRRIEELFGDVPRIELFARKRFHGWDCWGNEV